MPRHAARRRRAFHVMRPPPCLVKISAYFFGLPVILLREFRPSDSSSRSLRQRESAASQHRYVARLTPFVRPPAAPRRQRASRNSAGAANAFINSGAVLLPARQRNSASAQSVLMLSACRRFYSVHQHPDTAICRRLAVSRPRAALPSFRARDTALLLPLFHRMPGLLGDKSDDRRTPFSRDIKERYLQR